MAKYEANKLADNSVMMRRLFWAKKEKEAKKRQAASATAVRKKPRFATCQVK